jgi:hypothetical protein
VMLEYGYVVCVLGLLVGAFCQREKRGRRSALIFGLLGIILMVLLFPGTQYAQTKSAGGPNSAVERMRASHLGEFAFLAQWRLARTAHRHRSAMREAGT